jgi:hypothetical protein
MMDEAAVQAVCKMPVMVIGVVMSCVSRWESKKAGNPILNNATGIHPSTSVGGGRQHLSQLGL